MSVTRASSSHVRRPHINPWLVAVIGLSIVVVALGAWTLVGRREARSEGLAAGSVATMLADRAGR